MLISPLPFLLHSSTFTQILFCKSPFLLTPPSSSSNPHMTSYHNSSSALGALVATAPRDGRVLSIFGLEGVSVLGGALIWEWKWLRRGNLLVGFRGWRWWLRHRATVLGHIVHWGSRHKRFVDLWIVVRVINKPVCSKTRSFKFDSNSWLQKFAYYCRNSLDY